MLPDLSSRRRSLSNFQQLSLMAPRPWGFFVARPYTGERSLNSKLLVTVGTTSEDLGIGRTLVYQLINSGELESVKIGGARRVVYASIEAYVERLRQQAQKEEIR